VVGPVQPPQEWTGGDEDVRSVLGLGSGPQHLELLERIGQRALPFGSRVLAQLSARTLGVANRVVAISEAGRELAIRSGADPERVVVIAPPIDRTVDFGRQEPPQTEPFRIVIAGHLIARKAVDTAIAAVAQQPVDGPAIELVIAGDGPEREPLERLAGTVPTPHRVIFTGRVGRDELFGKLRGAALALSMSRSESWGGFVIEAMAMGVPVISAANLGARSQHQIGAPIRLVEIDDAVGLAAQIGELARQPDEVSRLGQECAEWVRHTLAADIIANRWLRVLRESLDEGPLPRRPLIGSNRARAPLGAP
ncbi:MAG TPA: glycosyltransferase family 4 protein, partial [Solirubrobacteraceae bacterium]|nr:glycosyltransferase family 4 protein [Solirubrobacteraceae bacterium]